MGCGLNLTPLRGLQISPAQRANTKKVTPGEAGVSVWLRVGGPKAAKRPRPERATSARTLNTLSFEGR